MLPKTLDPQLDIIEISGERNDNHKLRVARLAEIQ